MDIDDLSTLVSQHFSKYNGQLRSQMIQHTLDDIGSLYHVDPYNQTLYFQVTDEISRQAQNNEDFRFGLSSIQIEPSGSQVLSQNLEIERNIINETRLVAMLNSANTNRSKLDLAYLFATNNKFDSCSTLLIEIVNQEGCVENPEAAFNLGQLYLFGQGVLQDMGVGFKLISCAAQNGYKPAFFDTGFCYYIGWGTEIDNQEAEYWLNESLFKTNNPQAAVILGGMYQEHATTIFGLDHIIELVAWAINILTTNTYQTSNLWLGQAYYVLATIMSEHKNDENTAFLHLTQSANLGNMAGQNGLGFSYYHGLGCPVDKSQAEYWWSEAAKQNCPEACFHLGLMYGQGDAVQVDLSKAKKLIEIAAKSGRIPDAESLYQQILEQGLGL